MRINQRHHSLETRPWHTPPAAVRKPTEESTRERGLGVGLGRDSRYGSIYVCPPPPRDPAPWCSPRPPSPSPSIPGISHPQLVPLWALAWDVGPAGCIERRSENEPTAIRRGSSHALVPWNREQACSASGPSGGHAFSGRTEREQMNAEQPVAGRTRVGHEIQNARW